MDQQVIDTNINSIPNSNDKGSGASPLNKDLTDQELIKATKISMIDNPPNIDLGEGSVDKERMTQFSNWLLETISTLLFNCSEGDEDEFFESMLNMHTYVYKPVLQRLKDGDNINFERFTPKRICPTEEYEQRKRRKMSE